MANNQETIADIIAEKRRRADEIERDCAEKMKRGEMVSDCYARELVADIRREADRIEAALKREKTAIEADALAVGGIVEAERKSERGDYAKLREALEFCVKGMCGFCRMDAEARGMTTECVNGCEALRKAKVALAAPPRNCDVMPNVDKLTMCDLAKSPCKSTLECASREELLALVRWLLAPATEQKGETK